MQSKGITLSKDSASQAIPFTLLTQIKECLKKKCPHLLLMKCKIIPQTALIPSYNNNNDNMNCIYTNTDTTTTTNNNKLCHEGKGQVVVINC